MNKNRDVTTEIFKGKAIPDFIKNHSIFRSPIKIQKVFPSIGIPNFKEKANIDKCLIDVKKEGTYVHTLLRTMLDMMVDARDSVTYKADKLQYLETKEARDATRAKRVELYDLTNVFTALSTCVDPYNKDVLDKAIQTSEGKIVLKLLKDIADSGGKVVFRKDESLFKIFNKIKDKCTANELTFTALDQTDAFKIFSKENIPNKEFCAVFSAEGPEGAWDILTMSMRGIKSCQRWDGEYPKCLIGSILSKFVGIIYLTSGVDHQNLGAKMMRRCVVRYGIDADEEKPCILIDKMYPELDEDVLGIFVAALSSKTQLPVHYTPKLANKLRHIYIPAEKIRMEVSDREWSYQDTPMKSKNELDIYILNSMKDEVEREVKGFRMNLGLFIARNLEEINSGSAYAKSDEVRKTINNIRMNTSFTPFCDSIVVSIMNAYRFPASKSFNTSKLYYRKYLMEFLMKRKEVMRVSAPSLSALYTQNTSRVVDAPAFSEFIFSLVTAFTKSEIKKIIN